MPGGPIRARPIMAQGGPQWRKGSHKGPAPTRAWPARAHGAHKGPGTTRARPTRGRPTRARPTTAQRGPPGPRGASKGPAYKGQRQRDPGGL